MTAERANSEAVGENYDAEKMRVARAMTRSAMHEIAASIHVGMLEEQAMQVARQTLKSAGLLRGWHGIHVRFGRNTLKPFGAPSDPGVALEPNDVFFIDIGPVWKRWEADSGDTFVVGDDPDMVRIASDVRTIFRDTERTWRDEGLTGQALYEYASNRSAELGWQLNLSMNGHRLADFPHAALHKGALAEAAFTPTANLWVLEIQIRHPERPFGAFYEDLLGADENR